MNLFKTRGFLLLQYFSVGTAELLLPTLRTPDSMPTGLDPLVSYGTLPVETYE